MVSYRESQEIKRIENKSELDVLRSIVLKQAVVLAKKDELIEFLRKERDEFEALSQQQANSLEKLASIVADNGVKKETVSSS